MKVLVIALIAVMQACAYAEINQQQALAGGDKKQEKRGIGFGYGATGFGYDTASLAFGGYPSGYVAPTVVRSTYAIPSAAYPAYDAYNKYAYNGFYPGYTGFGTGYAGFPASYGKIVQPATSTYTKVVQSYPASGGVVSPAVGYTGIGTLGGYVY